VTIAAALLSLKDNATELLLRFTIAARSLRRRRRHRRESPRSHARIDPRANRLPSGRRVPTKSTRVIKSTQRRAVTRRARIRERLSSGFRAAVETKIGNVSAIAAIARDRNFPITFLRLLARPAASGSSVAG